MSQWYKVNIKFQKEDQTGSLKTITEQYLFDAVSFTEAEANGYNRIETGVMDFSVTSISKMRLADVFTFPERQQWYLVKVVYLTVDEKSGKEKKTVNRILVNADGIFQALERVTESMRHTLIPYEVTDIYQTPILEVFPYQSPEEENC